MNNYLICSVGRRVNLIKWFKEELNKTDKKLYVIDQDINSPALYYADDYFVIKEDYGHLHFILQLITLCHELDIKNILSLHDYQILTLTKYKGMFDESGIKLLHNSFEINTLCLDKSRYNELPINQIPTFIVKNKNGSGSVGLEKVKQPLIEGKEYNIQCYFDFDTKELIDVFMQEKISMRAGETDKSISVWNNDIYKEIKKLDGIFKGVIDIDVIKAEKVYIIDINARFGGGYPLAHKCGMNYIENLIDDKELFKYTDYKTGVTMMKYNGLFFKD